jgi:hypothetical protein
MKASNARRSAGRGLASVLGFLLTFAGIAISCGGTSNVNLPHLVGDFDASQVFHVDGDAPCQPKTCAELGFTCGWNGDGCGNAIQCGSCAPGDECGSGGFSRCGRTSDGGPACSPTTCAASGYDCGFASDGCGGLTTCQVDGGTCPAPGFCGGGGFDRCGGDVSRGTDGGSHCVARTCKDQGFDCGPAGDGCGHLLDCGTCSSPARCGGAGTPSSCGTPSNCTGLCLNRPTCAAGKTTTITGTVRAAVSSWVPAGTVPDPVPGVLVYVPNGPVKAFGAGAHCGSCSDDVSGDPLVATTTDFDGTFTLTDVPVSKSGSDAIPVVIQLGRWRRQFSFVVSQPCANNPVGTLNMPSVESATSDIPLTAISTGAVDSLECVLLKMGVDPSQFTSYDAANPGRIHLYSAGPGSADKDSHGPGAYIAPPSGHPQADESVLMGTGTTPGPSNGTYMQYDQVMLPCWGVETFKTTTELANLVSYAKAGGHFFATHFSYTWLYQNDLFAGTAAWDVNSDTNPSYTPFTGTVSRTVPLPSATPPGLFARWLNYVGALDHANPSGSPPDPATVTIQAGRHDVDHVLGASHDWIDGVDPNQSGSAARMTLHFTFDVNACGHAIFSDFHVNNQYGTNGVAFPNECTKDALSAQERILEYMIWDLASCASPPSFGCTPRTCAAQGIACGPAGDGCGGVLSCGDCGAGQTCGGGGVYGQCGGTGGCEPKTCADQHITCGPAGDGCGGVIQCGDCTAPQTCGGGGVHGQCGGGGTCTPATCASQNFECGATGDGCGSLLQCGDCPYPESCGGGGMAGRCGGGLQR